ncbi:MAG: hypothetical protein RL318_1056 [Fibrobacterota bacterium]|jgi:hypothetical protein
MPDAEGSCIWELVRMEYQTLEFPWIPRETLQASVVATVLDQASRLAASLGAYRFGRRASIKGEELRIEAHEVDWDGQGEGMLKLRFVESEFLACRYETSQVPHEALMRFQVLDGALFLKFLAPGEDDRMEGF